MTLQNALAAGPVSLRHHDAAPHSDARTEWWYAQGHFTLNEDDHSFMVMAVRVLPKTNLLRPGWLLLISAGGPDHQSHAFSSRASRSMAEISAEETYGILIEAGMPVALAEAYVAELTQYGPPVPIRISDGPVQISEGQLDLSWEDFHLRQTATGTFEFRFLLPGSDASCAFTLRPETTWFWDPKLGDEERFGTMAYAGCPRLHLTGTVGSDEVEGQAWLDHQWGESGWFEPNKDGEKNEILAWAWIAVNLDDGRDLLITLGEDIAEELMLDVSALLLQDGMRPQRYADVQAQPVSFWQSPDTHAKYPVAWRIEIPELQANLEFRPNRKASEIPLYGYFTAVWEGAGSVEGTVADRSVSCRGHLELYGYALPSGFEKARSSWIERIDRHVEEILPKRIDETWLKKTVGPARWPYDVAAHTSTLSEPAWELLSRGGKHWRSVFGVLMLRALGIDVAPYEKPVTVIPELLHAGSLMIDDIQDRSSLRRGGPAIHLMYGDAITINAANSLYFLPLRTIENHPHLDLAQREEIYRITIDLFIKAHAGQAQDLYAPTFNANIATLKEPGRRADQALQTYVLKTAAPVKALAGVVCVIARTDAETRAACEAYAEMAGIAYQIMDDVRNIDSNSDWGKDVGEDIREGRMTYAILRALERLDDQRRVRLLEILATRGPDTDKAMLSEGIDIIKGSGALEECRSQARAMVETAWADLSKHVAPSVSKTMVRLMFSRLFDEGAGAG